MFESVKFEAIQTAPVLVLGIFQSDGSGASSTPLLDEPAVLAALARREWKGTAGHIVEAFPLPDGKSLDADTTGVGFAKPERVVLVGLGRFEALNAEKMREIAAKVGRHLAKVRESIVLIEVASALLASGVDEAQIETYGQYWGESLGLLSWKARTMRGTAGKSGASGGSGADSESKGDGDERELPLVVGSMDARFARGLQYGLGMAQSVNFARTLSQTPPNIASPRYMADQAEQLAREVRGLSCTVIEGEALAAERLTGLVAVGQASANPSCLIRLAYTPEHLSTSEPGNEERKPRPLVLLGKTVTYDTGGLSLKINNGMVGMKRDKDGGCAVLGAMHAITTLIKPDFPVVGLLVAAENMVSDAAMRPDDVLTYRNGVTVEVTNTDAEGRLVLADGLCWASEVEQAAAIVDLATLTGGVVVALGSTYAGLFCEEDGLRSELEAASLASGERIWRLPMHAEYREMLKSPVADIINSNPNRKAHPIQGASFLSYFVAEGIPWAHIDIAGVHAVDSDQGAFVKGPTGFGVRLLAEWVKSAPLAISRLL